MSGLALKYLLTQKASGNAVVIVVGGAAEALLCRPGASTIYLRERKGFVKLALKTGWVPRFWCPKPVRKGSLFTLVASFCSFTPCLNCIWGPDTFVGTSFN